MPFHNHHRLRFSFSAECGATPLDSNRIKDSWGEVDCPACLDMRKMSVAAESSATQEMVKALARRPRKFR